MAYAYPSNVTGLIDIAIWSNSVTGGMFWGLILFGLFVVLFLSFKSYPTEKAFAASSFITMIISIMFGIMGLIGPYVYVGSIILAGLGMIALRSTNNREY